MSAVASTVMVEMALLAVEMAWLAEMTAVMAGAPHSKVMAPPWIRTIAGMTGGAAMVIVAVKAGRC